jgi:hypothetical protein
MQVASLPQLPSLKPLQRYSLKNVVSNHDVLPRELLGEVAKRVCH